MSEFWTYRLSDFLLFSPQTYYRLFALTNEAMWPWQIAALAAGCVLLWLLASRRAGSFRAVSAILGLAWAASGWFYVFERYATINWAASYLAIAFAAQSALLVLAAIMPQRVEPARRHGLGLALATFAVLAYPAIAIAAGRPPQQAELFGLMPDPTAITTLGALLSAPQRRWLLVIPGLACMVSTLTLWAMDSVEALVPFAAVLLVFFSMLRRSKAA